MYQREFGDRSRFAYLQTRNFASVRSYDFFLKLWEINKEKMGNSDIWKLKNFRVFDGVGWKGDLNYFTDTLSLTGGGHKVRRKPTHSPPIKSRQSCPYLLGLKQWLTLQIGRSLRARLTWGETRSSMCSNHFLNWYYRITYKPLFWLICHEDIVSVLYRWRACALTTIWLTATWRNLG